MNSTSKKNSKQKIENRLRAGDWRAVFSVGPTEPVRVNGDNAGKIPFRISVTRSLKDEIVRKVDDYQPFWEVDIHWRLWCVGVDQQAALKIWIEKYLDERCVRARKSWRLMNFDEDLSLLSWEIQRAVEDAGFEVWNDDQLWVDLQQSMA